MRKLIFLVMMTVLFSCQSNIDTNTPASGRNNISYNPYDSIKALDYGADAYGMKKYVMAFLKRGSNQSLDSAKSTELQKAHLANIVRMAEEGKLVLAGPFFGNDEIRGIYIFNVENIDEAKKLIETDPAIKAGSLEIELKEWYGSAALQAVNDIHKTIAKEGIAD